MPSSTPTDARPEQPLDTATVYAAHAEFVWKSLHRLGVRDDDLEDMIQEVFVIVHRKLDSYDREARVTTWLFGICLRVASDYRRRAFRRRECTDATLDERLAAPDPGPEQQASERQAQARLGRILDEMDVEKRAVFVLFELDRLSCGEIATLMDVPVGTVYSRLAAARRIFADSAARPPAAARVRRHA